MKTEWESMTIRKLMQEVLSEKLLARKAALERRLHSLNQLSNDVEAKKPRRP